MDKKKICYIILAAVILLGILVTCIWGFNVDIIYKEHKQVDIYIGKQFDNKEIEKLAEEVLGQKAVFAEKVELYEDMVSVNAKEITDEQLNELNEKINEKYDIENEVGSLEIVTIPKVKLSDKIKPYIMPTVICAVIILVYSIIRYKKLGILNVVLEIFAINVLAQGIYFSVFAITRLPINRITIPGALLLAIATIFITFYRLENKKEKKEIENSKK